LFSVAITSCGVPLGAKKAEPRAGLEAGIATLRDRRHIRQRTGPRGAAHRQRAQAAGFDVLLDRRDGREHELHATGEQVAHGVGALVRHVDGVEAGPFAEDVAAQVGAGADTRRRAVELAWICLCVRDELLEGLDRQRRVHHQYVGHLGDLHDRHQVGQRVVAELWVQRRVHGDRADRVHNERVAVGGRPHYDLGAEVAASAGFVVDDELLFEPLA
jgi:hypothetical protein